jgi:hypothetical protein
MVAKMLAEIFIIRLEAILRTATEAKPDATLFVAFDRTTFSGFRTGREARRGVVAS